MITRAQNKIAQSRWALPWTSFYAALVCLLAGLVTGLQWQQLTLLALSTLFIAELNNAFSLIRIYSRMVSCSFLVMTTMSVFLLENAQAEAIQLGMIVFYLYLFKAYQNQNASSEVFTAFFAIGMISLLFVQILFFVPMLWIFLAFNILAFTPRTFIASLLGVATPYWFACAYYLYVGHIAYIPQHLAELGNFVMPFQLNLIDAPRLITAAFILVLAFIGIGYFMVFSNLDKIRTRMIYEVFITMDALCFVFILLQPQHFDYLLSIAIVTTAPLIGHYLGLSHTKISNICFWILILLALLLTGYNLWISSTIF